MFFFQAEDGIRDRLVTGVQTCALPILIIHAIELPVMGSIAAGVPIEAISHVSHKVAVPAQMLSSSGEHYALEVKGDSMIDAGINDGDVVVIRETSVAENGDIVVALVEDHEATLKRFVRRSGGAIALEARSEEHTSELQSQAYLVCRLLLEKKKNT